MTERAKGIMAEDKGVENANAIQREVQYIQKIANLFPDNVLPLEEEKRWKALISKNKRSTNELIDCSPTTPTYKYTKVFQERMKQESDGEINAIGTISRSNPNVKRQKATISKNKKSAGSPTCRYTGVSQDTLKHLESDGESTIFKKNSSVNAEIPSSAPNAALLPNHFPSMISPPRPSLSPMLAYSCRKENADSGNSGFVSPQQQHTPNIMHYGKDSGVYCSGALCYEQQLRGEKHKAKLQCSRDLSVKERNKQVRCDLCEIYCQDETLLEMHLKGKKHKAKEHELEEQHTPNIMHYCNDCGIYCSGALCYKQHLRGEKHKAKLQCSRDPSVKERNKRVRCDLCEIYCQDETLLEMHLKGKKHKAKEHELEHGEKIKDENGQQFWCELCQVPCMNEETFTLHCNGKKHRKHLFVFEEKKKKAEAND